MDWTLILTVAPLVAGLEFCAGVMALLGRPTVVEGIGHPQWRRLGWTLIGTAMAYALVALGSPAVFDAQTAQIALQAAPFVPWAGALAVAGVFFGFRLRAPKRPAPALVRALHDPQRRQELGPEMQRFAARINSLAKRSTRIGMAEIVIRSAFVGTVVALGYILVDRVLIATGIDIAVGYAAPMVLAVVVGIVAGVVLARTTPAQAAVRADLRLGLRERIATALTIDTAGPFADAVRRDAVLHLERAPLGSVTPWRWPWQGTAALAIGVLLVGAAFLPQWRFLTPEPKTHGPLAINSDVANAIKSLAANRRELTELADEVGLDETKKLMREIQRVLQDLESRPSPESMSDEEKLKKMAELSDLEDRAKKMRDQLNQMRRDSENLKNQNPADPDADKSAADKVNDALSEGNFDEAAKAFDEMKRQLDEAERDGNTQKMDELKKQFQEESDKLRDMAEKFGNQNPLKGPMMDMADMMKNMSPEDFQKLKDSMQNMQDQMQDFGNQGKCDMNQQMLDMLQDQLRNSRMHFGQPPKGEKDGKPSENPTDTYIIPPDQLGKQQADQLQQLRMQMPGQQGGNSPGQQGDSPGEGGTSGGPGDGSRRGESDAAKRDLIPWLQRGQLQPGDIIATMRTMGMPPSGEALTQFRQSYEQARREAEDSLTRQSIPSEYRPLARQYFDAIHPRGDSGPGN